MKKLCFSEVLAGSGQGLWIGGQHHQPKRTACRSCREMMIPKVVNRFAMRHSGIKRISLDQTKINKGYSYREGCVISQTVILLIFFPTCQVMVSIDFIRVVSSFSSSSFSSCSLGHGRTSARRKRECQNRCQKECQIECQSICQKQCQIECQNRMSE